MIYLGQSTDLCDLGQFDSFQQVSRVDICELAHIIRRNVLLRVYESSSLGSFIVMGKLPSHTNRKWCLGG